jgi:hypothetical protein
MNTEDAEHEISLAEGTKPERLQHTSHGKPHARDSKAVSSRSTRRTKRRRRPIRRSWAFTRSTRRTTSSHTTHPGRVRHPRTSPSWPKQARVSPRHNSLPTTWGTLVAGATPGPPPPHAACQYHAVLTAMATSQHQSLWLARQPAKLPPSRAAALASKILHPKSISPHVDESRHSRGASEQMQNMHDTMARP